PYPGLHLQAGSSHWSTWMTRYCYTTEAGGAAPPIYEAEGGDGNAWPDGPLSFIGFEVRVRLEAFGERQGEIYLGSITPGGMKVAYADPFVYADSLLSERGVYRVAVRVTNEFQGASIRESVSTLTFDPEQLQSRHQRITFPLGPDGNYWIAYQITNATGKVVAGDFLRTQAVGSPVTKPLATLDPRQAPALGYLRINPTAHTNGVYGVQEPLQVLARVFPKGAAKLTLSWRLRLYAYDTVVQTGTAAVAYHGEPYRELPLKLAWLPGHDAYRLTLQVKRDGVTVDEQEYLVGRQTDFSHPYGTRTGKILDRDYVKQSAYFRVTYHNGNKKFATEEEQITHFRAFCDNATPLTRYATYMIDLAEFEILPGVYDFSVLDRIMDIAADRGCALTIRLGHADGYTRFNWLPYLRQYSFDGTPVAGHPFYGGYALTYHPYLDGWFRAYRALYDRYRTHPGFQGYYLMKPGGEWTVIDRPNEGVIAGYEPSTVPVFREYLQQTLHLTLAQLNARWGTQYARWDDVLPPLPDFTLGVTPDLRMAWLDFVRFKASLEQWWFIEASKRIRAYDPNHVIIAYHYQPDQGIIGKVDYLHNGGNQLLNREGWFVDAWKGGTGWISEPHSPHRWAHYFDPAEKGWILDWTTFILMAQAGGGGANLHVYYYPNPTVSLPAHYGGSY
ncbi:MAG TPA: beta-galactosidase, partial [Armatimonadota bacterium]